ncbi:branched-chain amino acid ABC transporter permease [Haloferax namakaokahaiae]|uniref:Branched-chain amino acid ABC transporter permease n=1 Tax=Haloferax namakaokahaiae TaxID=1748331 RepID=A0ABD5ZAD0_9EURY
MPGTTNTAQSVLDFCGRHAWALIAAFFVVFAALPLLGLESGYNMTVLIQLFIFALLALSWDLVGGQTGYPSFGNMAFFGVGAYTTAILVKDFGVSFPPALLVAGLLSVLFAVVIGLIVLRLRGGYFAIGTLGILLAATQIARNLEVTGGASGKILLETPSDTTFYYVFLGLLVAEVAVTYYLTSTRFGYVLNTIRDDETKATAMGTNTTYYKTVAWVLAALFTGCTGGAWSLFNTFVDPMTAFNTAWNVELIAMALVGGAGTVAGPVIGAFALRLAMLQIDTYFTGWQLVVLGAVVILTVVRLPDGVVGTLRERASAMEYYEYGGGAAGDEMGLDDDADGSDTTATGGRTTGSDT